MLNLIKRFSKDDHGFVVSSELVLILTIGVIGLIVGLDSVQNAVTEELADIAGAIGALNQSYSYQGWQVAGSPSTLYTMGSSFADLKDMNDAAPVAGVASESVVVQAAMGEN